jgi:hypothetical protein
MKTTAASRVAAALLLSAACLPAPSASARPPSARPAQGKVLSVDRDTRTFVFKPESKPPSVFAWNRDTLFVHNWQLTNSVALREGLSGTVYYRSPLFRKPSVTKVVWENGKK